VRHENCNIGGMTIAAPTIEREPSSGRAQQSDILARLKRETAAEHAAIEEATGLTRPDATLGDYRHYLERSYGFYQVVERELQRHDAWGALGLDAHERTKLPLIADDLEALGRAPESVQQCAAAPSLPGLAEALGAAYVLEGSTLGGRVISRHLTAEFGSHVPRRFVNAYGAQTGDNWQAFRAALGRFTRSRAVEDRIVAGARETFRAFTRWLGERPPSGI
jgi:heme oxygenase